MNEKTKNVTTGTLYRVNYSYVAKNGAIRGGGIAINAPTKEEALTKAQELIQTFDGISHPKVTGARPY